MSRTVLDHVRPGAENSDLYTRATERSDAQRSLRSHAQMRGDVSGSERRRTEKCRALEGKQLYKGASLPLATLVVVLRICGSCQARYSGFQTNTDVWDFT